MRVTTAAVIGGLEMQPPAALVQHRAIRLFQLRSPGELWLAGVMIGRRNLDSWDWEPARLSITVESVVVHGIRLHIGPIRDLISPRDIGWPLYGTAHVDARICVYVRNDGPAAELRAVLVIHGRGERGRAAPRRALPRGRR